MGADFSARASAAIHDSDTIRLRGDVEILTGSAQITADEADLRAGEALVRGNVKIRVRPRRWRRWFHVGL
jgi:lipopolysaccharide assembly outer membrane protein LptD (OstA)